MQRPEQSKIAALLNSIARKVKKGLHRFLDIIGTKPQLQQCFHLEDIEGILFAQIEPGKRGEKVWFKT